MIPASPEDGRHSSRDHMTTPEERRAQLQGAYRVLKAVLEEGFGEGSEFDRVIGQFNAAVRDELVRLRRSVPGRDGLARVEP